MLALGRDSILLALGRDRVQRALDSVLLSLGRDSVLLALEKNSVLLALGRDSVQRALDSVLFALGGDSVLLALGGDSILLALGGDSVLLALCSWLAPPEEAIPEEQSQRERGTCLGSQVYDLSFGFWLLVLGGWGLEFRVSGAGFGVQALERHHPRSCPNS